MGGPPNPIPYTANQLPVGNGRIMLVVMESGATPEQIARVIDTIKTLELTPHSLPGPTRTAIAITGNTGAVDSRVLEVLDLRPAVLDEVTSSGPVVGPVRGADVAEVDRAIARLQAVKLEMVALAERERVAEASGMSGTAAWLAAHTRTGGAEAAQTVGLATALEAGLSATRSALGAGDLSTEHASIIAGTMSRLPSGLTAGERARVEASLVARARRALEAAERSADDVDRHADDEMRGEEERAAARVRLTMHDNRDGTVSGHFTVPALAGAILRKVVQQIASPRRDRGDGGAAGGAGAAGAAAGSGAGGSGAGGFGAAGSGTAGSGVAEEAPGSASVRPLDWAQRYGQAFVEVLEHLPTDRLPGRAAANVVVTVGLEELRAALGVAHLDTGHDLSAAEARRLACGAGIIPAVLGGASIPLDLGRTARFFSEPQRTALASVYDECAAEGCDRPYAWCELHHEDPWSADGRTDLHLAVPLCGWHHRRVHDPRYRATIREVGGRKHVVLHRRT